MEHFRGDLEIIQEYERKQREIEKDEEALNAVETRVETISAAICDIKEPWHEKLKRLIADINASFSQFFKEIGCVGEVVLDDTLDVRLSNRIWKQRKFTQLLGCFVVGNRTPCAIPGKYKVDYHECT